MSSPAADAVAIVGAGCRFPGGAAGPDAFWRLLADGRDVITEVPATRWDLARTYDPDPDAPGRTYSRWGGFLDDVTRFDAGFFGLAPREARQIDPQQRLLVEVAWEALEDAGIVPGTLAGTRTSVWSGGLGIDYFMRHAQEAGRNAIDPWYASGKEASFGPGRLSYLLGLNGPSVAVSTACSSSLVAAHLARQSLLAGESDTALVGGVNVLLAPELTIFMSKAGAMARDGRCKTFDASADGIVRGDGCAVLVLKRLADAVADGDRVLAVIRGSAVNHDGHSAGLTVPSAAAQQALLRDALAAAGVRPDRVGFVEAHGTGTPLGDPLEMSALARVLGEGRDPKRPLLVGSLKTNFGHTDGAAGVAGLLKAALAVRHGEIPPHLHLRRPNPAIRWDRWPVRVPTELTAWPEDTPRLAGVSAFGLSGTNAHVIVEAPPEHAAFGQAPAGQAAPEQARTGRDGTRPGAAPRVLALSARSGEALRELAAAHRDRLHERPEQDPAPWTAGAARHRTHHRAHRLAVTGTTRAELAAGLDRFLTAPDAADDAAPPAPHDDAEHPDVCFVFSGQGGQWPGMGRELLDSEPVFARALHEVDGLVRRQAGWSPTDELRAVPERSRLAETAIAQPVIFALQVALAALWRSWGVEPTAVIGHSMGEIAAAHVAGALSLPDAVRIAVHRGRLLQRSAGQGRMAAVALPEDELLPLLAPFGDDLALAGVNSPSAGVVSGTDAAVTALTAELSARGVSCRDMPGGYAFHSPQMDPHQAELTSLLADLEPAVPAVPVFRTSGAAADAGSAGLGPDFGAAYWGRNVREPVRFADAMARALDAGHRVFLEVGPHPVLARPVVEAMAAAGAEGVVVPTLRRDTDAVRTSRAALARLYTAGAGIRWENVESDPHPARDLPLYPWRGEPLWFDVPEGAQGEGAAAYDAAGGAVSAALPAELRGELRLYDAAGRLVAETTGLRLRTDGSTASGPAQAPAVVTAPAAGQPPVPAAPLDRGALVDLVASTAAEVLGLASSSAVGRTRGFADLGMDSIGAVELCKALERPLGIRLPKTAAFDHPTVQRLAAHLGDLLARREPDAATTADAATPDAVPAAGTSGRPEPIAVVGIGCRFPGAAGGPDAYWRLLSDGVDAVRRPQEGRFDDARLWWGGFLDDADGFDAPFFRIPPREAKVMDPQQRMFLEVAWEALEDAGLPPAGLDGTRTGVFLGMNSTDYAQRVAAHPGNVDAFYGTGTSFSAAAGRLSYLFGLRGPSIAVDTACSSSLVAVHLAVASLRRGESDLAVAAGVNLILDTTIHRASSSAGALAADGRCKTFDASADGYTRGEGCGAVVLKPLSAAVRDGDRVLALVLGSAVNQDGASNGFTAPSGPAQEELLRSAFADAGVGPGDLDYVEAHGTGTPLGDPIELGALGAALRGRDAERPCWVGSVKTNIGHLEAASGIAGLIKTILALRHEAVPAHLHFRRPSPQIPWDELPLRVPAGMQPWPRGSRRRVAGVNAFGFSGTNAHVVLAEAPVPVTGPVPVTEQPSAASEPPADGQRRPHVLPLSAASARALRVQAAAHRDLLTGPQAPDAADLAGTLALRRSHLPHRLVVVGHDRAELAERLDAFAEGRGGSATAFARAAERDRGPVFVFSGHGSYWPGVAQPLARRDAAFRAALAECDHALSAFLDWSPAQMIESGAEPGDELDRQILLFAVQHALVAAWRELGVEPAAVVGHSMGEVSAALCAGALGLSEAAEVMVRRTRLLRALIGKGGMAVVGLDADDTARQIARYGERLHVAIVNSRRSTVVSGESAALEELGRAMKERNVFFRAVDAGGPAHSPWAEPLRAELVAALSGRLTPGPPRVPMYSSVDGAPVAGRPLDADYWGANLRMPVRFADAIRAAAADGHDTFVELSAHPIQLTPIEQELRADGTEGLLVPSLLRDTDGELALLTAFGALHAGGAAVDWHRLHPRPGMPVSTPGYPWEHRSYWVDNRPAAAGTTGGHPLTARSVRTGGSTAVECDLDAELLVALGADAADRAPRVPAAAWLEMAVAAVRAEFGPDRTVRLTDVAFDAPMPLPAAGTATVRLSLTRSPDAPGAYAFQITASGGDRMLRLAAGGARPAAGPAPRAVAADPRTEADAALRERAAALAGTAEVVSLRAGGGTVVLELRCPPRTMRWHLDPGLLELALRAPALLTGEPAGSPPLPAAVSAVTAYGVPGEHVVLRIGPAAGGDRSAADVSITDPDGRPLVELAGVRSAAPPGRTLDQEAADRYAAVVHVPGWQELPAAAPPVDVRSAAAGSTSTSPAALPPVGGRSAAGSSAPPADAASDAAPSAGAQATATSPVTAGTLLLVTDGTGVGDALAAALGRRGTPVRVVAGGPADRLRSRLAAALAESAAGPGCAAVLHLAGLDLPGADLPDPAAVAEACAAVSDATDAVGAAGAGARLWWITRGAVAVDDLEEPVPAQAALRRAAVVAGVEQPGTWGGALDLDPLSADPAADAAAVLAEIAPHLVDAADGPGEDRLALRSGRRLAERLRPAPPAPALYPPLRLDSRRSYLVAGAGGPLAEQVAGWLSARGAGQVLAVPRVESAGHARRLLEDQAAAGRPVDGIVWLGVEWNLAPGSAPGAGALAAAVEQRAAGAWLLHQACRQTGTEVRLFQVWSTVAGSWGAIGAGRQAPADALLTALVARRRARGLPATSVAWAPWSDVGLLDRDSGQRLTRSGMSPFAPAVATELLDQVAAFGPAAVEIADVDWGLLLPLYRQALPFPLFDVLAAREESAPGGADALLDKLRTLPADARADLVLDCVLEEVGVVLGLDGPDELEPRQGFFELGLNSITALETKVRLERRFGSPLPATLAFEYPNGQALAAFLIAEVVGAASPPAADGRTGTGLRDGSSSGGAPVPAAGTEADDREDVDPAGDGGDPAGTGGVEDLRDVGDAGDAAGLAARLDAELAAASLLFEQEER